MKKQQSLLPWFINKSLSADEEQSVVDWLQHTPKASIEQQATLQIAEAIKSQELQAPSIQAETTLFARISQASPKPASILPWAWGIPILVTLFALLWIMVQPGTQLQWTAHNNDLVAFRIYRAPAGSKTFELLDELPASTEQNTYHYADTHIFPGGTYYYVIEIIDQSGRTNLSPAIQNNTIADFASQIAILLTSFILTFGIITIVRESNLTRQLFLAN